MDLPPTAFSPINRTQTQHDGTHNLAINNTRLNRFLTLLALNTVTRFYTRNGDCIPISKHKIVKTGIWVHLTEAATMKFVAENTTSVPVPRVYCSFVHKNRAYIVMQRMQGADLPEEWRKRKWSDESLEKIFAQLRAMFLELRSLKPEASQPPPPGAALVGGEGGRVESCVGSSLRDVRNPRSLPRFGPFKTIQQFHSWLREDLQPKQFPGRENDQDWQDIKEMVDWQDGPWDAPPVFTHGDLNPFNIIVHGDDVVGIVDWECAGWYPYYWEYTSAWWGNVTRTGWQDLLDKFLQPFPNELRMEVIRQKWWGEF
ncbi:hypothetical protein ACJ72_00248 [Emergomyces africanus]|uniref:Aminoglycoside phosphotransferase domain-containing protein n=1 Tax=Emergomyces africanus TaxID=1955775 RepID=A0A1B7P8Q2_9EURO|nr:hypothetical protein ACJ72_00248 [Emergomyces africanus]